MTSRITDFIDRETAKIDTLVSKKRTLIERLGDNDKIVTRYMADQEFQGSAFPILAREIFEAVRTKATAAGSPEQDNSREP